jgi:hypothetical protein
MSWLSSITKKLAPVVATVSPDPVTKAIATGLSVQYQKQDASYQKKLADERALERQKQMATYNFGNFDPVSGSGIPSTTTQQAGQGGFLGGVTDFFKGAGDVIGSAFGSGLPQLFGFGRPPGVGQQPAITTVTNVGAQESQGSGSIQAGVGSLLPTLVSGTRSILKSPFGQLLTGTGIGTAISMIGADGKPMRVTRKMKAQAKNLLNMTGGNLQITAEFLGISEQQLVFILLKRFRNDGPVVTKAALRKTKSTIRKMKNMCDMYDDLRPSARRRTPVRRRSSTTTLIKN